MAKKTKIETKKSKRTLRVTLTRDELLGLGKSQADKLNELGALENDRKRMADDFKAKMSALEATIAVMANQISSGYEFRPVACTEYLGQPPLPVLGVQAAHGDVSALEVGPRQMPGFALGPQPGEQADGDVGDQRLVLVQGGLEQGFALRQRQDDGRRVQVRHLNGVSQW